MGSLEWSDIFCSFIVLYYAVIFSPFTSYMSLAVTTFQRYRPNKVKGILDLTIYLKQYICIQ